MHKALETIIHHGGVSTQDEASSETRRDGCPDSVASGIGVPVGTTAVPSLALVNAVLAMAPTHHTALRCRATIMARVGRTFEALIAADRSVSAAENAARAAKGKAVGASCESTSPSRMRQAPSAGRDGCTRTFISQPVRSATGSGRHLEKTQCSGAAMSAVDALGVTTNTRSPTGGASPAAASTCSPAAAAGIDGADYGWQGRGPAAAEETQFIFQGSIGFMKSSKATVVVGGGLLLTGGGRVTAFDVAKSLVLRGCLRQKLGRSDQAEQDYRRALEVCHSRLGDIERRRVDGREAVPGVAASGENNSAADPGSSDDPFSSLSERIGRCEGPREAEDSSDRQEGIREVLKLENLIHQNLASLHIAAVLGTDIRTSLRKVCRADPLGLL